MQVFIYTFTYTVIPIHTGNTSSIFLNQQEFLKHVNNSKKDGDDNVADNFSSSLTERSVGVKQWTINNRWEMSAGR